MNELMNASRCSGAPSDRANGRRMMLWSIGWALATVLASAAHESEWAGETPLAALAAGIAVFCGAGTVLAYRRFLRETDELRRKVEMEALSIAFGVGVVGGLAYAQFSRILGAGDAHLAYVVAAMLFVHSLGVVVGMRRYA